MTWGSRARRRQDKCAHETRSRVLAAGVERTACGKCGHVSFAFIDGSRETTYREWFAREADERAEHSNSERA
jgi:ribosomal protein S27AE